MSTVDSGVRRTTSVDALRGLVMIIMALDHTRDFFHLAAMSQSPTDLSKTSALTFLSRWITHLCAPTFVLLAGVSARLWLSKPGRTKAGLSRFLITRGLWLIAVELIVMRIAFDMTFSLGFPMLLIILYALGASMIVLAGLIYLPRAVIAGVSIAAILLHNATDGITSQSLGALGPLWTLLHQPGAILLGGPVLVVGYPLIPWFAVMALGYCLGEWLLEPSAVWRPRVLRIGAALTVAFVVVRALNVYGDPAPWSVQPSSLFTVLSFLNTTKYPASLQFLLMTLGPSLLVLGAFADREFRAANPLVVYGRVPFFYYIVHFYLLHVVLIGAMLVRYGSAAQPFLWSAPPSMGGAKELFPADFGWNLGATYLAWITVVVAMYPLCRWYGALRARRAHPFLSYL